jgi:hypothetical protein
MPIQTATRVKGTRRLVAFSLLTGIFLVLSPPPSAPYPQPPASGEFVVVPSFKVGDRVRHTGRQESGTVTSTENGCVIVEFDIPTPRGNKSVGNYDAVWFRTHPNMLNAATKDGERA